MRRERVAWSKAERATLDALTTPAKIQAYLDTTAYRPEEPGECPRVVLAERRAHCFDGAVFAAMCLRRIGRPPLLLDTWSYRDDDHVIAVYRQNGHYGAISRSDFRWLRGRQPVYRTLRELVLSYFEGFISFDCRYTLRSYSGLFDMSRLDRLDWESSSSHMQYISDRLDALRHRPLFDRCVSRGLERPRMDVLRAALGGEFVVRPPRCR